MYLASFQYKGGERVGLRRSDGNLIDLADAAGALNDLEFQAAAAQGMVHLLQNCDPLGPRLQIIADNLDSLDLEIIPADAVRWRPPVRTPGKVIGVAMNNSASDARKISAPDHPMFFLKAPTSLIGHLEDIEVRPYYGSLHPEPELAVVIGRRARDLDPQTALDAVFGYTIINDLTGNDMRAADMVHYYALYGSPTDPGAVERREQHLSYAARYKGTDHFGPIGPWLATRDEVANPDDLDVVCSVGGVVIAEDSTRYLTYGVREILAFISCFLTLEPGDIVSMGTAFRPKAGVQRSIHTANLQRVDGPVEVSITTLGTLKNGVRRTGHQLGEWRLPRDPAESADAEEPAA